MIKIFNQFINLGNDEDSRKFVVFNNNTIYYNSLLESHPYTMKDYCYFIERYGSSFRLELVYD